MRTLFCIALLFFSCLPCISGAEKHVTGTPALIWEVTHSAHPGKLYLAGTIHACRADMYPLDAVYDDVLKKSDYLVFEIAQLSPIAALGFMIKYGFYQRNSQVFLPDVIGEKVFRDLTAVIQKSTPAMTPERAKLMKPWTFITTLSSLFVQQHGFRTDLGMEKVIQNIPAVRQKEMRSLETVTSQLAIIAAPALEKEMIFMLQDFHKDPGAAIKELDTLLKVYRTGNDKLVQELNRKTKKETPLFYQAIMAKRNEQMTEKLYKMLAEKKTGSVWVGLGHFCGEDSILVMLKNKGCRITTLKYHGKNGTVGKNSISERK